MSSRIIRYVMTGALLAGVLLPAVSGMTVIVPDGGERWIPGSFQKIYWWNEHWSKPVTISLSMDGGVSWRVIQEDYISYEGECDWYIPLTYCSERCLIKVDDGQESDVSGGVFTIPPAKLQLTSPVGGETLLAGASTDIRWIWENMPEDTRLRLQVSCNAGLHWMNMDPGINETLVVCSDGLFKWYPDASLAGNECLIKLSAEDKPDFCWILQNPVYIAMPELQLLNPAGGENWLAGSSRQISWTSGNCGDRATVCLRHLWDGGAQSEVIATGLPARGSYEWEVPAAGTATGHQIEVFFETKGSIYDISGIFSIPVSSLELISPAGGEVWTAQSTRTISWISQNLAAGATLSLLFSKDDGLNWTSIVNELPNQGFYDWLLPVMSDAEACRIMVRSSRNHDVYSTSPMPFTIQGSALALVFPEGGESLPANSIQRIRWDTHDIPDSGTVLIYLSTTAQPGWQLLARCPAGAGQWTWQVPQMPTDAGCRIKIILSGYEGVGDETDSCFTITGPVLTLLYPNGGETVSSNSVQAIRWSSTSSIPDTLLSLFYSGDDGANWKDAKCSFPDNGSGLWNVPPLPGGARYRLRLSNQWMSDESDGAFSVDGSSLTITTPAGGEVWNANGSYEISWTSLNILPGEKLRLSYSLDGGANWTTASNPLAGAGQATLNLPSLTGSDHFLLKLAVERNDDVYDLTDAELKLNGAVIRLLTPNGGESWIAGSTRPITWQTQNMTNTEYLELQYSLDGGMIWSTITSYASASRAKFDWTVPVIKNGSAVLVRLNWRKNGQLLLSDASDRSFCIPVPLLRIVSPNGGEAFDSGSSLPVRWVSENLDSGIELKFCASTNGGQQWTYYSSLSHKNTGEASWAAGLPPGANMRIKIYTGALEDVSDGDFIIRQGMLRITAPLPGDVWAVDTAQIVRWESQNLDSSVNIRLYLSTDEGITWVCHYDDLANTKQWVWVVPSMAGSKKCRLRLEAVTQQSFLAIDTMDGNFELAGSSINITAPKQGDVVESGGSLTISWTSTNISACGFLNAYLYKGESQICSVGYFRNTGSMVVKIPISLPGTDYRIRLHYGFADSYSPYFTIAGSSVHLIWPDGGENLLAGSSQTVRWNTTRIPAGERMRITYSSDGGTLWRSLGACLNTGAADIEVPLLAGGGICQIKVAMDKNESIADMSDHGFTIPPPAIRITSPQAGDHWVSGNSYNITWSVENLAGSHLANIYSSTDGGSSWEQVGYCPIAACSFTYTPVSAGSEHYRIKITVSRTLTLEATTGGDLVLEGSELQLLSPAGGETLIQGEEIAVTWRVRNLDNQTVRIYLWREYQGTTYGDVSAQARDQQLSWVVPQVPAGQYYLCISLQARILFDRTETPVNVPSSRLAITCPNGGEVFNPGSRREIRWTSENLGPKANIGLTYTTDAGMNWNSIAYNILNTGSFMWDIPADIAESEYCRIKIEQDYWSTYDTSDRYFAIRQPSLTLLKPNGGEIWPAESQREIAWQSSLDRTQKVNLYYSLADPPAWIPAGLNLPNSGSFDWQIPSLTGTRNGRIKIEWADNQAVQDTSDQVFTIAASPLILHAPADGEVMSGSGCRISWSSGTGLAGSTVALFGSTDGGQIWTKISGGLAATGDYDWSPPFGPERRFRIRAACEQDSGYADENRLDCHLISGQGRLLQAAMRAAATSSTSGHSPDLILDHSAGTVWLAADEPPQAIAVQLDRSRIIQELVCLPSQEGAGGPTGYRVLVSENDLDYEEIASGMWSADPDWKHVVFQPVTARYIQLEVNAGMPVLAELNVYGDNRGQGDINSDGSIDSIDLVLIAAYLAGIPLPAGCSPPEADCTGDGVLDAADLVLIQQLIMVQGR